MRSTNLKASSQLRKQIGKRLLPYFGKCKVPHITLKCCI
jgi:hypothetical protein